VLSRYDDLPIHQVAAPIARPGTTDRNAYDRYWFGGLALDGSFLFEAAFGRYPNLGVVDASVSLLRAGEQHAFHGSAAAPSDPTDTTVGPLRLEVVQPMRELQLTIADNETGITADLTWRSKVGALHEDHTVMEDQGTVIVDMARFVQFGTWAGSVTVDGETTSFDHHETRGTRDRWPMPTREGWAGDFTSHRPKAGEGEQLAASLGSALQRERSEHGQLGCEARAPARASSPNGQAQRRHIPTRSRRWCSGLKPVREETWSKTWCSDSSISGGTVKASTEPQEEQMRWWWWPVRSSASS